VQVVGLQCWIQSMDQVKVAAPCAPWLSIAVTVTVEVIGGSAPYRGVPEIRPEGLMARPSGRPVAWYLRGYPALDAALICKVSGAAYKPFRNAES
jgi:hypothetical protein